MPIVYGSYSDQLGRRFILIVPILGSLFTTFLQMVIVYFDLPVWSFFFTSFEYLFGGFWVLLTGCFAYLADTIEPEKRGVRMTILDAIILAPAALGSVLVGYMIHSLGFFYPQLFCAGGKILCLVYAVFFIPETVRKESQSASQPQTQCGAVKNGLKLYFVDNGSGRRLQLSLLLLSYLVSQLISPDDVLTLFEMNNPLCWNSVLIGNFGAVSETIKCVAMIVAAVVLKRYLSDAWSAVLGFGSTVVTNVYQAFVISTLMMFFCKKSRVSVHEIFKQNRIL